MGLFTVKTTASQEETVARMIIERDIEEIHAALAPEDMTSYVFVEADSQAIVERLLDDIPHAQKVLSGSTGISEVEHFLDPGSDVEGIEVGDLVEITGGPYQGEKATITNIDESNDNATVELVEATVPIPVTLRGDQLRVLDSDEREPER